MKYIMFERVLKGETVERMPVIFPKSLVHQDVSKAIVGVMKDQYDIDLRPVSAGEISVQAAGSAGESTTLNLKASSTDAMEINMIDYISIRERD